MSKFLNQTLFNNEGEEFFVKEKLGNGYFLIEFLDGTKVRSFYSNFTEGKVVNYNSCRIYGVGKVGIGEYSPSKNKFEYGVWLSMLERCYSSKFKAKNTTYLNCTASENFRSFQYFATWCQNQIGFREENFALDKDIYIKGNKHYSEDTCFFIPAEINTLLLKNGSRRGKYPIGVYFDKNLNKLRAQYTVKGKRFYLGLFESEAEAFHAYKVKKESYVKEVAQKYRGRVDEKIYNSLMNYKVEVTD
jgi:hypothetical protein